MRRFGQFAVAISVTLLVAAASTSFAQGQPREECGQAMNADGQMETSIQACMGELLDEQSTMLDGLEQMEKEIRAITSALLDAAGTEHPHHAHLLHLIALAIDNDDDMQYVRNQLHRGREENLAVEDTDYDDGFEAADQQKKKHCGFSDMAFFDSLDGEDPPGWVNPGPKFGDGKCNTFMANDVDDPMGMKVRVNERKENMCERLCADRDGNSSPGALGIERKRKDERKDRTAFALTEDIAAAQRANEAMAAANERMAVLRLQVSSDAFRLSGEETESCEPLDVARGLEEAAELASLVKNGVAILTASLELADAIAEDVLNQDGAGFNIAAAEIPFSVAAGVSKIVEQQFGFVEQALKVTARIAARVQDFAQAQCLEGVQEGVAALKDLADANSDAIADLGVKVDSLSGRMDEVIDLLNTPPGRRSSFPRNPE